ncbi:MAG: flagellar hook assembly protein FlgD [Pseudomonadales bacterium]
MEIAGFRSASELVPPGGRAQEEELGKTQFLELMIAQLENQDPLDPAKNEDFIAQLAQFSTVEGIENLNTGIDNMAAAMQSSLTLQSASLVGRNVLVAANQGLRSEAGMAGTVELANDVGELLVDITDANGALVQQLNLGPQSAGLVRFGWNGEAANGEPTQAGLYGVSAYSSIGSATRPLPTNLPNRVVGVTLGEGGVTANLLGGSSVSTIDIQEIQ